MKFAYGKDFSFFKLFGLAVVLTIFVGDLTEAQTLPQDVGILTQLSGVVTYQNKENQKTPEKARAFMKVLQGDCFQLETKAVLQLIYFRSGRKEIWKGPVAFMADEMQSQVISEKGNKTQPESKILPSGVLEGVRRVPILLQRAGLSRSGTMQIRSPDKNLQKSKVPNESEWAEITMAKENYQNLRKQTKDDDFTPELYLLGILANYDQFEETELILKDALKKQPDNEILKELEEWVETKKIQTLKK